MRSLSITCLVLCSISVFYFSWLPDPSFVNQTYLPRRIVQWADVYVRFRTAIPFLVIGYLCQYLLRPTSFFTWTGFWISMILVCAAEFGQFFLPNRHPDWMDIVWGVWGAILGMFVFYLFVTFFHSIKRIHEK